jgi:site-specific recombinase XerD
MVVAKQKMKGLLWMGIDENLKQFTRWLGVGQKTTKRYLYITQKYLEWLNGKEPTPENLQQWLLSLDMKPSSVHKYWQAVKQYFYYIGKGRDLQDAVNLKVIRLPRTNKEDPPMMTVEQVHKCIDAARGYRNKAIIAVMYDCALRLNETVNLNRDDVDFKRKEVMIRRRKGGHGQILPINDYPLELLRTYLKSRTDKSPALFIGSSGRLNESTIRKICISVGRVANLPFTMHPHVLRHARAIHMRQAGVPIETIRDFLGHVNIQTTLIYARFSTADVREYAKNSGIW